MPGSDGQKHEETTALVLATSGAQFHTSGPEEPLSREKSEENLGNEFKNNFQNQSSKVGARNELHENSGTKGTSMTLDAEQSAEENDSKEKDGADMEQVTEHLGLRGISEEESNTTKNIDNEERDPTDDEPTKENIRDSSHKVNDKNMEQVTELYGSRDFPKEELTEATTVEIDGEEKDSGAINNEPNRNKESEKIEQVTKQLRQKYSLGKGLEEFKTVESIENQNLGNTEKTDSTEEKEESSVERNEGTSGRMNTPRLPVKNMTDASDLEKKETDSDIDVLITTIESIEEEIATEAPQEVSTKSENGETLYEQEILDSGRSIGVEITTIGIAEKLKSGGPQKFLGKKIPVSMDDNIGSDSEDPDDFKTTTENQNETVTVETDDFTETVTDGFFNLTTEAHVLTDSRILNLLNFQKRSSNKPKTIVIERVEDSNYISLGDKTFFFYPNLRKIPPEKDSPNNFTTSAPWNRTKEPRSTREPSTWMVFSTTPKPTTTTTTTQAPTTKPTTREPSGQASYNLDKLTNSKKKPRPMYDLQHYQPETSPQDTAIQELLKFIIECKSNNSEKTEDVKCATNKKSLSIFENELYKLTGDKLYNPLLEEEMEL